MKKIVAYRDGKVTRADLEELGKEVGDILWYLALFADRLGLSLDDIAHTNLKKLDDRQKRGVIRGEGDNR